MKTLMDEWGEYLRIVERNKNVEYESIHSISVPRIKEQCAGCFYFDGKIIGVTNSSRELIIVDPIMENVSFIGKTNIGTFKWTGGGEYTGKCYGFPRKNNSILSIDIKSKRLEAVKLNTKYRGEHHYSGVITEEGIVYQPPRNTDHVLCIDLNNLSTWTIPMPNVDGVCRYSSAVLHPSGDIYMIPEFGFRTAILHKGSNVIEYFGDVADHLVFGGVVGIDGNIYGFSKEGNGILKIIVKEKKIQYICQEIGNPDCYGSVIGINGRIYGIPGGSNTIWEYSIEDQNICAKFEVSERGIAKCAGGGVGPEGAIVMMPCFGNCVYLLKCDSSLRENVKNRFLNTSY